jgi:hypothetical protein
MFGEKYKMRSLGYIIRTDLTREAERFLKANQNEKESGKSQIDVAEM